MVPRRGGGRAHRHGWKLDVTDGGGIAAAEAGRWRVADRQKEVTGACANTLPVVPRPPRGWRPELFSHRLHRHLRPPQELHRDRAEMGPHYQWLRTALALNEMHP